MGQEGEKWNKKILSVGKACMHGYILIYIYIYSQILKGEHLSALG